MYQCYSFYTKLCSVFVPFSYLRNEGIRLILRFDRDLLSTIIVNSCPLLWSCVDGWFMFMHPFRFAIIQAAQQQQESKHTRHHYPHTHNPVPTHWLRAASAPLAVCVLLSRSHTAVTHTNAARVHRPVC